MQVESEFGPTTVYELADVTEAEGYTTAQVLGELSVLAEMSQGPLVRVHSACLYGEVFASRECDCGPQLEASRELIAAEGLGIIFYLHDQEGRGAGARAKAMGYYLTHTEGLDTFAAYERLQLPPDQRQYSHCGRFLQWANIRRVRLLTNNPDKTAALEPWVEVERRALKVGYTPENQGYRDAKKNRGHLIAPDE